jgi:uncharacterized membrane protein YhaH (DUF805 family)
MSFETLYVNPKGRTPRGQFLGALIVLLAVAAFYAFLVKGRTAQFCMLVLLFPAVVLHARRLHDMGMTAWPLIVPAALIIAIGWIHLFAPNPALETPVGWAAVAVCAAFALWGLLGKGQAEANRFGEPTAA